MEELLVQISPPVQAGPVDLFGEDEANVVIGELGVLLDQLAEGDIAGFANGLHASTLDLPGDAIAPYLTFDDHIGAGIGKDIVFAGIGEDAARGHAGNDIVMGEDGSDDLRGGDGVDYVNGELGDDISYGGSQSDFLVFDLEAGYDEIRGFEDGIDQLDFRASSINPANFDTELLPAISAIESGVVGIDLADLGSQSQGVVSCLPGRL